MDVSAPRPVPHTHDLAPTRVPRSAAATTEGAPKSRETGATGGEERRWAAHSALKSSLTPADVEARFAIHEPTSRVTVTMTERVTGEVLRDFPSRRLLDTIAGITTGLRVDESR